ncbi:MAG: hypothetical protein ACKOB6_01590 [Candidatus Kapaibacterium sp.]
MQKVPVRDREIKSYHEILPKEERPAQGGRYLLSLNDEPTYVADITEFKGGCWATVRVVEAANEKYAHLYAKDMEFEIKVAQYGFRSAPTEPSQDAATPDIAGADLNGSAGEERTEGTHG